MDNSGKEVKGGEKGLLLYYGNTVCDDNFDDNAAEAICRKMGYSGSVIWTNEESFEIQKGLSITHIQCDDDDWSSCSSSNAGSCGHSEDVFLRCITGLHYFFQNRSQTDQTLKKNRRKLHST